MPNNTRRITNKSQLPERTDEGRRLAEEAMSPFLKELQRAADEETRLNFGLSTQSALSAAETADCVITFPSGDRIEFKVSDVRSQNVGEIVLRLTDARVAFVKAKK